MPANALLSLEERMDAQLHAFGYAPADEENRGVSLPRAAVRVGAAGALAGGGVAAYQNRAAIATAGKDVAKKGLKKTASMAGQASNSLHKTALKGSGLGMKAAGAGSTLLQKTATGLRKVAKTFSRADVDAIIDLAERVSALEDDVEFAEEQRDPEAIRYIGRKTNGFLGGGFLGGREALIARDKFQQAGHVYRKRDAAKDGLKGGLGSVAVMAGGVGGSYLAGKGMINAAKSGSLPKGSLRKNGVKAAQILKKAGRSPAVAVGGTLAAVGAGMLAGKGIQRRSADKRLTKRQSQA